MKTCNGGRGKRGFTLLELMLVAAIIAILASLLLPVLQRAKGRTRQIECVSQLRQVGLGFHGFAHDHGSRFPFQTPVRDGGTLELVQAAARLGDEIQYAFRHFQALSNDLSSTSPLVCPADQRTNTAPFAALRNEHLSYFAGVTAEYSQPSSILSGDRNVVVTGGAGGSGAVLRILPGTRLAWSRAGHQYRGNLLYGDGHVDRLTSDGMNRVFAGSPAPISAWMPVGPSAVGRTPASGGAGSGAGTGGAGAGGSTGGTIGGGSGGGSGASGFAVLQRVFDNGGSGSGASGEPLSAGLSTLPGHGGGVGTQAVTVVTNLNPAAAGPKPNLPDAMGGRAEGRSTQVPSPEEKSDWAELLVDDPDRSSWPWWVLLCVFIAIVVYLGARLKKSPDR